MFQRLEDRIKESQFEFLRNLRPRGLRDVGKVECHVFVLKVCLCHLSRTGSLFRSGYRAGEERCPQEFSSWDFGHDTSCSILVQGDSPFVPQLNMPVPFTPFRFP